jgi:TolB-like protein/Tfp pilus assembly protein PilF
LPNDLENILNRALQKNPGERYDNLNEMLDDLKKLKRNDAHQTIVDNPRRKRKQQVFVLLSIAGLILAIMLVYFLFINDSDSGESSAERKMLVVLPFKNLGLQEHEYFADGITGEISSRLSEIKQLGIIGRTSADQYKNTEKSIDQIGEELGVDYLLEGSVRWEKLPGKESRIRVTPQLIKVSDGTQIWTERYDAIHKSVFDLQSNIAEKVAKALDITLLGTEQKSISQKPTDNLEAYDYYLRGNYYFAQRAITEENYRLAEKMFLKTIGLDSNFALPYIRLAQINTDYYWFHWERNKNRLTRAKHYIDKALEINRDIPEIYVVQGHYYYAGFLDYDKALYELEKGLKIYPDNGEIFEWIGYIKRRQGKFEEAISYLKGSIEMNPLSYPNFDIGETYLLLKKYEEAEKYIDIAISSVPERGTYHYYKAKIHIFRNGDVNRAYQILKSSLDVVSQDKLRVTFLLVQIRILEGKYEEAMKMLSDEPANVFENQFTFLPKPQIMANILRLQNKNDLAKDYYDSARVVIEDKLKELPDDSRLHSALGIVLAGLGQKDEAVNMGKRAVELLPIEKEAWRGWHRELDLAKIYTIVGEYDLAIEKIDYLLSIPGELSVPYIKLDPVWKDLLELPRMKEVLSKYE